MRAAAPSSEFCQKRAHLPAILRVCPEVLRPLAHARRPALTSAPLSSPHVQNQHLSERITLLYNLVRSSFDFVDGSPRHARHNGSDSR